MSDKTPTEEIEALRSHNVELLSDLKKSKNKVIELTQLLETTQQDRDKNQSELTEIHLNQPVREMLGKVSILPDYFLTEFNTAGYNFVQSENGISIKDGEGNPVMIGKDKNKEVQFSYESIRELVLQEWLPEDERSSQTENFKKIVFGSFADGGGSTGSRSNQTKETRPKDKPKLVTGLR